MVKYDVFGLGGFVWMLQTNMAILLLDPCLNETAGLPDVEDVVVLT
jgi:hypothetical protein